MFSRIEFHRKYACACVINIADWWLFPQKIKFTKSKLLLKLWTTSQEKLWMKQEIFAPPMIMGFDHNNKEQGIKQVSSRPKPSRLNQKGRYLLFDLLPLFTWREAFLYWYNVFLKSGACVGLAISPFFVGERVSLLLVSLYTRDRNEKSHVAEKASQVVDQKRKEGIDSDLKRIVTWAKRQTKDR